LGKELTNVAQDFGLDLYQSVALKTVSGELFNI
jgi:hypothetical protein